MELTKQVINKYKSRIKGLDGYSVCVSKIESNSSINPDIAIEACKSLIEGLSKKALELLSEDYRTKKKFRQDCNGSMKKLVRNAFEHVYKREFEIEIHSSMAHLIVDKARMTKFRNSITGSIGAAAETAVLKISAIRDNRGDISHGRVYPKKEESNVYLAKSIQSITDGICSFMIHELALRFIEIEGETTDLDYFEHEEFNEWLNEKYSVLSVKADISKLLFKNAYEKYEEFYYSEYLPELEVADEVEEDTVKEEDKKTTSVPETKEGLSILVNTYNEDEVWSKDALLNLKSFSEAENLNADTVKIIVGDYLFSEKKPLPNTVIAAMSDRPSLKNRSSTSDILIEKIIAFSESLKK